MTGITILEPGKMKKECKERFLLFSITFHSFIIKFYFHPSPSMQGIHPYSRLKSFNRIDALLAGKCKTQAERKMILPLATDMETTGGPSRAPAAAVAMRRHWHHKQSQTENSSIMVKTMDSMRNWIKIFHGSSGAFLEPISRVRSVTETSMIFIPTNEKGDYCNRQWLLS